MADELNAYFQYAQLSLAAYTPLTDTFTGQISPSQLFNINPDSLGSGFSTSLANQFSAQYRILSHLSDTTGSGFSATLFEKAQANSDGSHDKILAIRGTNGPADLLVDTVNVALIGSTQLNPQYIALRDYIRELSAQLGRRKGVRNHCLH